MEDMEEKIQLAHGGGGKLSAKLIKDEILSRFGNGPLKGLPDAAELPPIAGQIIYSTDSFVVSPHFFPGGNIGELAVYGTVNDVCVAGGRPQWLSLALIIEEGFSLESLRRILDSAAGAAERCGVTVVTGDTKVVQKGNCDGIYMNTSGIGVKIAGLNPGRQRIKPGDAVIVSGTIGEHGFAVLAARNGICAGDGLASDCGPLNGLLEQVAPFGDKIKFMRDPTRGGVAAVLNEIVESMEFGIELKQNAVPVSEGVRSVSEMLGIDPLNVACEGRMVLICDQSAANGILSGFRSLPEGKGACVIGTVKGIAGTVTIKTITGISRLIDLPSGELLPRIC
jgi:hydrogenase expression/formation protein HypE